VFVSIYFPVKVPLHNITYFRKLHINSLLKLSERKAEASLRPSELRWKTLASPPQKKRDLHSLWNIVLQEVKSP